MSIDPHYNTPAWFQEPGEVEIPEDVIGEVVRQKLPGKHILEPKLAAPDKDPEAAEAARPEPPLDDDELVGPKKDEGKDKKKK